MSVQLNLFLGGPGDRMHEKMRVLAKSDPDIGTNFKDVMAFDDKHAKLASAGTKSWRNYLRTCDVAVFLYPAAKSGTPDPATGKSYTELEVEQAHMAGTLVYHLIEKDTGGDSELVKRVKALYGNNLGLNSGIEPDKIIKTYKRVLRNSVKHWDDLINYVNHHRYAIRELIMRAGRTVDVTTANKKMQATLTQEKIVQGYLAECWNLRRQCQKEPELQPELPRHLLRAYLFIVRPCLPPDDIEASVTGSESELWKRLASLLGPSSALGATIPEPSRKLFEWLPDWRQRALIKFLREVSIAFRYKLKLAEDWAFAKRAFKLYSIRGASIDPKSEVLFDLAIGIVPSAAYSLKVVELSKLDPGRSLINVLEQGSKKDGEPGAAQALATYYATLGDSSKAESYLEKAIKILPEAERKEDNHIHSLILRACFELGEMRSSIFTDLDSQVPNWQSRVHPIFSAMASQARGDIERKWEDILSLIGNLGGTS